MNKTQMTVVDSYEAKVLEALNQVSGITDPQQWLVDWFGGEESVAGTRVGVESALGLPAVWSSVQRIAGHIAMLPIEIRRKLPNGGSENVDTHPAYKVLNTSANERSTPMVQKESLMMHALLQGNGRMFIQRNSASQPIEFILLLPSQTYTVMVGGEKWHVVYVHPDYVGEPLPYGSTPDWRDPRGSLYRFPDADVFHIPGMGYNGLWGYALLSVAKDIFGIDLAGVETVGTHFRNSGRPDLVLEAPLGTFTDDKDAQEFLTAFRNMHQGLDKKGRTALLRDGITASTLPVSASDAQLNELRKLSREDIALLFGTELVMGDSASVYKDLTERNAAYIQNCLAKWFAKWQQEIRRKLFSPREREAENLYAKFDTSAFTRTNPNALSLYTGALRQQGLISGNEGREMHGFNPVDGLDDYTNPNVGPAPQTDTPSTSPDASSDEDDSDDADMQNNAIRAVFDALLRYEKKRVRNIAQKRPNFLDSIEKFYDSFEGRMIDACIRFGINPDVGTQHIEDSQKAIQELPECYGNVTASKFLSAVDDLTGKWTERAEKFCHVRTK